MLLLFVPVFFFSAALYMGKRVKEEAYIKLGVFYGISSLVTFIISALGLVWPMLLYGIITHLIVWVLCTFHTLNCREKYIQAAKWAEEDEKDRSPLVKDDSFRMSNNYWRLWNWVPLLGGFSTYFMGERLKKPVFKWVGALSTILVAGLLFYLTTQERIESGVLTVICLVIAYCSICVHPLLAYFYFEDYLDAAAETFAADTQEYPQMANQSWRVRNSVWQIATCMPYFGSLGLFWAGITRESGKVLLKASILCILEVACLAAPFVVLGNEAILQAVPMAESLVPGINAIWIFVYALVMFTGASIRREMLLIRAEQELEF